MTWAEPWAYGELALKPWEFYRLTVREFLLMLDGFWRRYDRQAGFVAQHACWVIPRSVTDGPLAVNTLWGRFLKPFPWETDDGHDHDEAGGV